MDKPNVIYAAAYEPSLERGFLTCSTAPMKHDDVEYIRKDALLEWAKEAHDSGPIKDSADKGDAWSIGYLCGMKDLIDKLNSM